jgi:hypothetical protein
MKLKFKIVVLMLIISTLSYAQRHRILKQSIVVDKNSSVILNIENIYVAIEESTDGKIHFDYSIEFDGYSKNDIQKKLDEVSAEVSNFDNAVTLKAKSENQLTFETIQFKSEYGITLADDYFKKSKDTVIRKSKDSLVSEIRRNNRLDWGKSPLKYINDRFKRVDLNGKLSNIRKGSMDIMRSQFVIRVPPFIKININGKSCGLYVSHDLPNELSINLKSGTLKTKTLYNAFNKVNLDDANFEAESISGGDYEFKNVKNGKIGSVQNTRITSEFSKLEIGEIGKNTTISDFNSEFWFYNWTKDFERFNLYSEYSKIHFFSPEINYELKAIGNNTKSFMSNDIVINMQPTSKGEKYTMMTTKADSGKALSGQIFLDIVHGIIYSYNFRSSTVSAKKEINKDVKSKN